MLTLVYLAHTQKFRLAKIRVTGLKEENLLWKTSHTPTSTLALALCTGRTPPFTLMFLRELKVQDSKLVKAQLALEMSKFKQEYTIWYASISGALRILGWNWNPRIAVSLGMSIRNCRFWSLGCACQHNWKSGVKGQSEGVESGRQKFELSAASEAWHQQGCWPKEVIREHDGMRRGGGNGLRTEPCSQNHWDIMKPTE